MLTSNKMDNSLFLLSRADIFSIYPKIFKELVTADDLERQKCGRLAKDFFSLPSDYDWKLKVYFRLLELQRKLNEAEERGEPPQKLDTLQNKPLWDQSYAYELISPHVSPSISIIRKRCIGDDPIDFIEEGSNVWSLEDISKAGMLLKRPPLPCLFHDEHEMRRVYSLIYDVFRYKIVLNQGLADASFFSVYPELQHDITRVWLLLFDFHTRHFLKRDPEDDYKKNILYEKADLLVIDNSLWAHRVRLAAAISRLRIKKTALTLSELLPFHLQNEKVAMAAANPIVSGWLNPFRFQTKTSAVHFLHEKGFQESIETEEMTDPLTINHYKWDKICPLFMQCLPMNRGEFAQSELVQKHNFIFQDRAFTIGPAMASRLLDHFEINGDVIQTHVSSPRSTAYLACLFLTNNRIKEFLAFGAGSKLAEYRSYMTLLGINNVKIFAENFCDLSLKSPLLERAVGIFATPPSSYSGVTDPIDLICSRGGDLTMLEVLTESEISDHGKQRVVQVLQEQRETLRLSLSRPQIQFVLYETHSIVRSENEDMVQKAIENINRAVQQKHYIAFRERIRQEPFVSDTGVPVQTPSTPASSQRKNRRQSTEFVMTVSKTMEGSDGSELSESDSELDDKATTKSKISSKKSDDETHPFDIPSFDLFEVVDPPDICLNQDKCLNLKEQGCYLALIKRKDITKFDSKYLIKMAETRGLFGDSKPKTARITKLSKKTDKKADDDDLSSRRLKRKKSDLSILINRLTTPTLSFLHHSQLKRLSSAEKKMLVFDTNQGKCKRHLMHHEQSSTSLKLSQMQTEISEKNTKNWWKQTSKYISKLSQFQLNDKKIKPKQENIFKLIKEQKVAPLKLYRIQQDDDLHRKNIKYKSLDREPYPVSVQKLQFHNFNCSIFSCHECFEENAALYRPYTTQYINQCAIHPIKYYPHSC